MESVIFESEAEAQIRNSWIKALKWFYFSQLVFFTLLLLLSFIVPEIQPGILFLTVTPALVLSMQCALLYYFAYVKRGTKLLAFVVYACPVTTAISFLTTVYRVCITHTDLVEITVQVVTISIFVLFFVYLWVHSQRLYKINRENKKRNKLQTA